MSAVKVTVDWRHGEAEDDFSLAIPQTKPAPASGYVRFIAPASQALRCPSCDSIVYSRRSAACGVCAAPLPENLRFSPAEAARIQRLIQIERQQHKRWLNRFATCR